MRFVMIFCKSLKDAIQGIIIAPAASYEETLSQEYQASGAFNGEGYES